MKPSDDASWSSPDLLGAGLLVSRLAALGDVLKDLVSALLEACDGFLQLCRSAELLSSDTILQSLFSFQDLDLYFCQLHGGGGKENVWMQLQQFPSKRKKSV